MQILRNVAVSGVGAPLREILDPPLLSVLRPACVGSGVCSRGHVTLNVLHMFALQHARVMQRSLRLQGVVTLNSFRVYNNM